MIQRHYNQIFNNTTACRVGSRSIRR